jgi:hypothetical protein
MKILFATACLLCLSAPVFAQAPADRARAALALAQAPRPPQAPAVKAAPAEPPASVARAYDRMLGARSCPCSPQCSCGCVAGAPCDCRELAVPAPAAPQAPSAFAPVFFRAPAPATRGGGC